MKEVIYTSDSQLRSPQRFLKEMWDDLKAARGLGGRLFIANLRSQYRQNWLGYFWLLMPPILTGIIWIFLSRSKIINANITDNIYPVFVISGIFIWQTFVETLNLPIQHLRSQKSILSKVKVPHEAFIIAGLGAIIFNAALRAVLLLILLIIFGIPLQPTLLLAPLGLVSVILSGLAIALLFTPVGLLYNDIQHGLNTFASLWFFVTPVIYQIPPDSRAAQFLKFNPLTPLLETTRNWVISGEFSPQPGFFIVNAIVLVVLILSWILYRVAKPHLIVRFSS